MLGLGKGIYNAIIHKPYFCSLVLDFTLCFIFLCIKCQTFKNKHVTVQKGSQQMDVVSNTTMCCIVKSDTGFKKQ